jgi:hypothetical protein
MIVLTTLGAVLAGVGLRERLLRASTGYGFSRKVILIPSDSRRFTILITVLHSPYDFTRVTFSFNSRWSKIPPIPVFPGKNFSKSKKIEKCGASFILALAQLFGS